MATGPASVSEPSFKHLRSAVRHVHARVSLITFGPLVTKAGDSLAPHMPTQTSPAQSGRLTKCSGQSTAIGAAGQSCNLLRDGQDIRRAHPVRREPASDREA